jgi:hypothetical protein
MFLCDVQAHYAIPGELVEGGQLLAFFNPDTKNANPAISVRGNNINIANGDASPGFADNTDFGDVERGSSKILPFEIKNAGPGALIVRSIRFDGYNALDFSLISPTSFPLVIPVNGSQTIQVQFEPKTIGGEVASIIIFSNDFAKGEYEYVLQGMGIKPLGITPNNLPESAITVYPNPAGNLLNINFNVLNAATAQITMFDINGKSVLSAGTSTINGCSLNTSALSNGMYTLQITTDNGQVVRKKVVITR